jgi:hypothetical protein
MSDLSPKYGVKRTFNQLRLGTNNVGFVVTLASETGRALNVNT